MDWTEELNYIKSVNPEFPGKDYNFDSSCFARYCDMQTQQAIKAKKYLIAQDILQARDIAISFTRQSRSDWERENNGYHQDLELNIKALAENKG